VKVPKSNVTKREDRLRNFRSSDFQKIAIVHIDVSVALSEESINILAHTRPTFIGTVDVKSRRFLKLSCLCNADAKNILLLAGYYEIVLFTLMVDQINIFKVILRQRINFEQSRTLNTYQAHCQDYQYCE
jgi:hypothetical protein